MNAIEPARPRRRLATRAKVVALIVAGLSLAAFGASPAAAQEPVPAPEAPAPWPGTTFSIFGAWIPEVPLNSGVGRRIVYSVGSQRVWLVEADGRVFQSHAVSGKANTPAQGQYNVFSKSRYTTSLNGAARMEFMVRFAWGNSAAIGFHSIPVDRNGNPLQSTAELGQYRSAGCVRQFYWDAQILWDWAPVGTQVNVVK